MIEPNILNTKGSLVSECLACLRDKQQQKNPTLFRAQLKKVGQIMAYEISKTFHYERKNIPTVLGVAEEFRCTDEIVLISILRAAAPMTDGFAEMLPEAKIGMIGAMRKESDNIEIDLSYIAIPDLTNKRVIVIDPMLATGKSMVKTVDTLLEKGTPSNLDIACLVSAPEGIEHLNQNISVPFQLWTCAKDDHLNEQRYIIPGLGDAGDLSFGQKL